MQVHKDIMSKPYIDKKSLLHTIQQLTLTGIINNDKKDHSDSILNNINAYIDQNQKQLNKVININQINKIAETGLITISLWTTNLLSDKINDVINRNFSYELQAL